MKKLIAFFLAVLGAVLFTGCNRTSEKVDIYTSIYPIEFIVKEIVADKFVVKSVYPRGMDVHDYEATPRSIMSMSRSKLIFYIGLGLEKLIEDSKDSTLANVPTVPVSENISLLEMHGEELHDHEHEHDHSGVFYDPHIWLDPVRMKTMTDTILESLFEHLELDSDTKALFSSNAEDLKERLTTLDEEIREAVNDPTISSKTIIVDHDAYAYWNDQYGIERIRMRNDNESTDVSAGIQEKIHLAKSLNIKHICTTKNEMESKITNTFLRELGLTEKAKLQLHNLASITTKEEEAGFDYFSLMRQNLFVLRIVLPRYE